MDESSRQGGRGLALAGLMLAGLAVIAGGGWALYAIVRAPAATGAPSGPAASPQTVKEILDAARAYMDQDKAPAAEVILRAAVERVPESQSLRLLLGECLLQQDRLAEAYEEYAQGIFIGPDHPEYRFAAGTIASKLGRLEDAEAHYLKAQSMDRSNPKFPLYAAQVQRKLGKIDDARANLLLAANLDENQSLAWATLAAIALDENKLDLARQHIERARRIDPDRADLRVIEAKILRRGNEPEKAAAVLEAIPEGDRVRDAGVLLELSQCYGMLARAEDAAKLYVAAVGAEPDNAEFCYQAAVWLDRDHQRSRAATYAQHAAAKGHEGARRLVEAWRE